MPQNHRAILEEYSVPFLDQMIAVLTAVTIVCYALYAMGVGDAEDARLQWTIPFVLYGVLRYLYLVYHRRSGRTTRRQSSGGIGLCKSTPCSGWWLAYSDYTPNRGIGTLLKETRAWQRI